MRSNNVWWCSRTCCDWFWTKSGCPRGVPKILIPCSAVPASSPPLQTLARSTTTGLVFPRNRTPLALCRRGSTPSFSQRALGCKRAPRVHFRAMCESLPPSPDCRQHTRHPKRQTAILLLSTVGSLLIKLVLAKGEQKGHQGVPLPTLTLVNLMHGTHCILPPICRWTSVEQINEWENLRAALNSCQSRQHGSSGDEVVRADPVN